MRKVLFSVLALALFCGSAMAADSIVKGKVGFDFAGNMTVSKNISASEGTDTGFSLAGEYLYKINDSFRVGGGLQYLMSRCVFDDKFNFVPIYITMEVAPIESLRELYFKGNLGYNVLFDYKSGDDFVSYSDAKGGIYFGLGAGYEFDFGLIVETMYSYYYGTTSTTLYFFPPQDLGEMGVTYTNFGINVGYKFDF